MLATSSRLGCRGGSWYVRLLENDALLVLGALASRRGRGVFMLRDPVERGLG